MKKIVIWKMVKGTGSHRGRFYFFCDKVSPCVKLRQ